MTTEYSQFIDLLHEEALLFFLVRSNRCTIGILVCVGTNRLEFYFDRDGSFRRMITEENKMSVGRFIYYTSGKAETKNHKSKTMRTHRDNSKGKNARNYHPDRWYTAKFVASIMSKQAPSKKPGGFWKRQETLRELRRA